MRILPPMPFPLRPLLSLATTALLALGALAAPGPVRAADVTEPLEALHGRAGLYYSGSLARADLREVTADGNRVEVAAFRTQRHGIGLTAGFALRRGIELTLRWGGVVDDQLVYTSSRRLVYDADEGRAVMATQPELGPTELRAPQIRRGVDDLWFGARFLPVLQDGPKAAPVSLALRVALKVPTAPAFDRVNDEGIHGPGTGSPDLLLEAAFSRRQGAAEPYLVLTYIATAPYRTDLFDSEGRPVYSADGGNPASMNPPDSLRIRMGVELNAANDERVRFRIVPSMGFAYFSWSDIESGRLLPDILPATQGHIATHAEHFDVFGRLGLYIDAAQRVEVRMAAELNHRLPYTLERVNEQNYRFATHALLGANIDARISVRF